MKNVNKLISYAGICTTLFLSTSSANAATSHEVSIKSGLYNLFFTSNQSGQVYANQSSVQDSEKWILTDENDGTLQVGDTVTLRGANGMYLVSEPSGVVLANRTAVGPWERWTVDAGSLNSEVVLRSFHNTYLFSHSNGTVETAGSGYPFLSNVLRIDTIKDTHKIAIQPFVYSQYLTGTPSGTMETFRTALGDWERWSIKDLNGGKLQSGDQVTIKSSSNLYLVAEPNGQILANRTAVGPWETWTVEGASSGVLNDYAYLKSAHNTYLSIDSAGNLYSSATPHFFNSSMLLNVIADNDTFKYIDVSMQSGSAVNGRAESFFSWETVTGAAAIALDSLAGIFGEHQTTHLEGVDADPASWLLDASDNWMAHIPDYTALKDIAIPGTHDSAANLGGLGCRTQSLTLREQLDAGVRYLDIRTKTDGSVLAIHHGPCFLNTYLHDVLYMVDTFLNEHPNEVVVMRVKANEQGSTNGSDNDFTPVFNALVGQYIHRFPNNVDPSHSIGSLRGKIVLLRDNFPAGASTRGMNWGHWGIKHQDEYLVYGPELPTSKIVDFFVSAWNFVSGDNYQVPNGISIYEKETIVMDHINRASQEDGLFINHLSGVGLGLGSTKYASMTAYDVAVPVNTHAYVTLEPSTAKKNAGIVVMDFPGDKLIYKVISRNFTRDF